MSSYSGGERRRLEIARALTSRPQVLFLDEPTVGLDPRIRHELLDVIAGLRAREELTILLTTHYLDEAQRLCDRVAIIHEGSVVALDTPQALLAGLGREILEFRVDRGPERALASLRERGIAGDDAFAVGARVTVPLHHHAAAEALAAIESEQVRASEIATRVPNLDDVYLKFTGPLSAGRLTARESTQGVEHMSAIAEPLAIQPPAPARRARDGRRARDARPAAGGADCRATPGRSSCRCSARRSSRWSSRRR